MATARTQKDQLAMHIHVAVVLLAVLGSATAVVAPMLLVFPALAAIALVVVFLAARSSRRVLATADETWSPYALIAFWAIVVNIPSIVAFDQTGFVKDQGLLNPQSIGRILVFLCVVPVLVLCWSRRSRSPVRRPARDKMPGINLVIAFYGWYLLNAPIVASGTSLALSIFRTLEWIVAVGLLVLVFSVQNSVGQASFQDRLKLVLPMLLFLLFSNLAVLPVLPNFIYRVSTITGAGRLGGLFTHPNLLALVCVLLTAYALAFLHGWKRWLLAAAAMAALAFTYSRGGFAALAIMLVLAVGYLVRGVGSKLAVALAIAGALLAISQTPDAQDKALDWLARGTKAETLGTFSERTAVWEASKILIERSPLLGSGFISGPKQLADVMIEHRLSTNFAAPHAHNEMLQAQISGGPLALLLSLLIQLRIALLLLRAQGLDFRERFFAWSLFGGCLVWGFLQPSLSYFLYLPGILLIWLLLTLESLQSSEQYATKLELQRPTCPRWASPL